MKRGYILVIIFIFLIIIFYNFPFLIYPIYNFDPCNKPYALNLTGKILFISDVHLKGNENYTFVGKFLNKNNVTNLVIVGDLFYKKGINLTERDIFKSLGIGYNVRVIFVRGNHDPKEFISERIIFVGECAKIKVNNETIYATHGQYSSRIGIIGFLLKALGIDMERIWKEFMKINDWVIFGHFHIPEINYDEKYARCGGFIKRAFIHPNYTGVYFDGKSFKLVNLLPK